MLSRHVRYRTVSTITRPLHLACASPLAQYWGATLLSTAQTSRRIVELKEERLQFGRSILG